MTTNTWTLWVRRAGMALTCIALAACGGGGGSSDDSSPAGTSPAVSTVGAGGGAVEHSDGARVVVPAGALSTDTRIEVARTSAGAPPLPVGVTAFGPMFAFTPHGTAFAVPATVTVPFDANAVPTGVRIALYKTTAQQAAWERVPGATVEASSVTALIGDFSLAQVVIEPLFRGDPVREWSFSSFEGRPMTVNEFESGRQEGGALDLFVAFGGMKTGRTGELLDREVEALDGTVLTQDGIADGQVFSSADGVTYGAFAEAPTGGAFVGGRSELRQYQAFIKRSPDARLTFTLSQAFIEVRDDNGGFNSIDTFTDFPGKCIYPAGQVAAFDACQDILRGQLILTVQAYTHATSLTQAGRTFFNTGGVATTEGHTGNFRLTVNSSMRSTVPLWKLDDFSAEPLSIEGLSFNAFLLELKSQRTYTVDLSSLPVGTEFTLRSVVLAEATDRQGDKFAGGREAPKSAAAFLRDPLGVGGTSVVFSGLEPIGNPVTEPPPDVAATPAACAAPGGADPQAGTIQFTAPAYTIEGHGGATQPVLITRSGGSRGAVTATFTTSNGSAVAGADYQAVSASVFFADGDSDARLAEIVLIPNPTDGELDKTVNLRLTDPGNCATLGAQSSAVLTLIDNKAPPPPSTNALDAGFGIDGKAVMPETGTPPAGFGGEQRHPRGLALQADGKIVMVGGSAADFILARFNANGTLDTGFGIEGKVITDMGSGNFEEEVALAVAIQADGKIVVVGHSRIPTSPPAPRLSPTFSLTRYLSDGNLDTSFGIGGRVQNSVNGIGRAVAIQPDGKIVVAGEFSFESNITGEGSDITVARFNSNGTLDLGFGGSGTGQLASDIGGRLNTARQLVLQPDGRIVVSGTPVGVLHTDLMRFNANGLPDNSFGSSGKLTILGSDLGQGLSLQADGKLVLVGTVVNPASPATSRFLLRRLSTDGTPDNSFGTASFVDTALSVNATAGGVALQADGRIVVVGSRALSANSNFVVVRYATDGALDTGFGVGGTLSIDFFQFTDIGENILVQPDGKILVSGSQQTLRSGGYALARVLP